MMKIIIANWKMNPPTEREAKRLFALAEKNNLPRNVKLILCPPFPYLYLARHNNFILGAQNLSAEEKGAQTGEISGLMLKNMGVKYVIVGHSERRKKQGETDELINLKTKKVLEYGLTPVLCVGESREIRDQGIAEAQTFVRGQLNKNLESILDTGKIILAYEPIWAISSQSGGKSDDPENAIQIIRMIKKLYPKNLVIYGGSVNSNNIGSFISRKEVDGVLPGAASVNPLEFRKMIRAAVRMFN